MGGLLVSGVGPRVRVATLIGAGAWLVHQFRYSLAFGEDAGHTEVHAHLYLEIAGPILVWAIAVAMASWVLSLRKAQDHHQRQPIRANWPRASIALAVIYSAQEALEGLLAPGHSEVLLGIVSHGGWIAFPLAVLVGALISLVLLGAYAVRVVVARGSNHARRRRTTRSSPPPRRVLLPRQSHVLATSLAGRAPPASA